MRSLIFGGSGMLGHRVWELLRHRPNAWATVRSRPALPLFQDERVIAGVDARDFARVERLIADLAPDVVVNCIGVVKQHAAAQDAVASITVNALLPHVIARACDRVGARLIHISTDCVFSGRRGGYTEADLPDPPDLYGRSKLLGEVAAPHLTLRTSIIGRELSSRHGLLEWFLGNAGGKVPGYTRARFSGVTTLELARLIERLVEGRTPLAGLYHAAAEPISKYELLTLLEEAFGLGIEVVPDDSLVIDRTLDGTRLREATGWRAPSWPGMVEELASQLAAAGRRA